MKGSRQFFVENLSKKVVIFGKWKERMINFNIFNDRYWYLSLSYRSQFSFYNIL